MNSLILISPDRAGGLSTNSFWSVLSEMAFESQINRLLCIAQQV
ncbi:MULTISPECIES: hypothetical protein [unclassified Microcoleus]|nr:MULTISPECIES: hypothetical protein [unclassified Microcoleus]